jgi:hypothetical protein
MRVRQPSTCRGLCWVGVPWDTAECLSSPPEQGRTHAAAHLQDAGGSKGEHFLASLLAHLLAHHLRRQEQSQQPGQGVNRARN